VGPVVFAEKEGNMSTGLINLQTDSRLLKALEEASLKKLTHAEILAQRISFVFGSMKSDSTVTRDRVKEVIVQQEGATECAHDSV
jgi:hypothetical protein